MKHLLVKNALFGGMQFLITLILTFIGVPIFNHILGSEVYGIFAAITVFGNLNVLASLGFNLSLIKNLAEQGKTIKSNIDIITAFFLSTALVSILLALILFNADHILSFLQIKNIYYYSTKNLLVLSSLGGGLAVLGQVFSAILDAQNKVYINNALQSLYNVVYWLGIIVVLLLGKGLHAVAWVIFLSNILWFLLLIFFSLRTWSFFQMQFSISLIKLSLKTHLRYGSKIYVSSILGFLFEPLTKLLLAKLIGLNEAGYLDIALRLKGQVWGLFNRILYPVTPYLAAEPSMDRAIQFTNKVEKIITVVVIPLVAITYLIMPDFIQLWLHKDTYETKYIASAASFITIAYLLFSVPIMPLYSLFAIKSKPSYTIFMQATNAIVNVLILFVLAPWLKFDAVVISISVSILLSYILLQVLRKKFTGYFLYSTKQVIKILAFLAILLIVGSLSTYYVQNIYMRIIIHITVVIFVTGFIFQWYLRKYINVSAYVYNIKSFLKRR